MTKFGGVDLDATITAGINGVKSATLQQNPMGCKPRPDDVPSQGEADNRIKRIYFFFNQIGDKMKAMKSEVEALTTEILGEEPPRSFGTFMVRLCDGSKLHMAQLIEVLERELQEMSYMSTIVGTMFWAEARRRNRGLHGYRHIVLHSDWTFTGSDEPSEKRGLGEQIAGMFGVEGAEVEQVGDNMFAINLSDILRRRGRGNGHADGDFGHHDHDHGHEGHDHHAAQH